MLFSIMGTLRSRILVMYLLLLAGFLWQDSCLKTMRPSALFLVTQGPLHARRYLVRRRQDGVDQHPGSRMGDVRAVHPHHRRLQGTKGPLLNLEADLGPHAATLEVLVHHHQPP